MRKIFGLILVGFLTACAAYPVIPASIIGQSQEEKDKLIAAAESGDLDAQYRLGNSYCCGEGALYNNRTATKWLCSAAKKEHLQSQIRIAQLYKSNSLSLPGYENAVKRLPPNDKIALAWYIVARGKGAPEGKDGIEIFRKMEFDDVVAAIDLSRKYPDIPCEIE